MAKYVVEVLMVFETDAHIPNTDVSGTFEECEHIMSKATAHIPKDGLRNQRMTATLRKHQSN